MRRGIFFPVSKKGSVFVMTLVFASIFTITGLGLMQIVEHGGEIHSQNIELIKSYWAAEAAQQLSLRYLSETWQFGTGSLATINDSITYTPKANAAEFGTINGYGLPLVHFRTTNAGSEQVAYSLYCGVFVKESRRINCITYEDVTPSAMSTFTLLSDNAPSDPWVDLMVDGNFHVNSYVNIGHTMTDTAHVTGLFTVADTGSVNYLSAPYNRGIHIVNTTNPGAGDQPSLIGADTSERSNWLKRRIPRFSAIGKVPLNNVSTQAFEHGMILPRDARSWSGDNVRYRVVLDYNKVHISIGNPYAGYLPKQTINIADIPNQTIIVDDEVSVKGILDGKLTIVTTDRNSHGGGADATQHDINILDDIVYANRNIVPGSGTGPVSDDFLTLVSGGDVKFAMHSDHNSGTSENDRYYYNYTHDITVCASIFAPNGKIHHEYDAYFGDKPPVNYHIYGSAIVDSIVPSIFRFADGYPHGFILNYHKDPRYFLSGVTAPKVGTAAKADPEIGTTTLRWSLYLGKWENQIITY